MGTTTNIKIGAASVNAGGTDLGHTKGGVTFNYSPEYADIMADQYGSTPIDKSLKGELVTVKVPLTELQVARLLKAMPLGASAGGGDRMTFGQDAGARLLDQAVQLVIHPLTNNDNSEDIVLHKAAVHGDVEFVFEVDNQRVAEVEFIGFIDTSKSEGNYLGFIGDSTA